jgi:Uma2 family endonuclease
MALVEALTIDDFEKLPAALALNHELVDGELVDVSGNTPEHNQLRDLLVELLAPLARQQGGKIICEQEFDFGGNAYGPDAVYIGAEKLPRINRKLRVQRFVPDLAIEIVSESDSFSRLTTKAKRYRDCGVAEVWVFSIDTRQAFHYSARRQVILEENDAFAPEQLPGFSIRIGELLDRI